MTRILDANGQAFPLGRELGRGGEGTVFEVTGQPNRVAKLYHEPPDLLKQQKLRLMAAGVDDRLRQYAAWPEATLHRESDQAVIGFVMQRIERRVPIHMLYHPGQRRKQFPKVRFDFLLYVARNIAAAFATLHDHGHVLGDVNQGNVLVGEDSQAILIDCDSFQVRFGESLHRCEVGVAHFTPPELQRMRTFETITRTPNHDCFGLALLIFHLLMGGRHPFSGVPQSERVGQALEADIRDYRYAYARDAKRRLLLPPPRSVPIEILPERLRALFEQAFCESGRSERPSAEVWVAELDRLRADLKSCSVQSLHVYPGHLQECCWCALDSVGTTLFGIPVLRARKRQAAQDSLDLTQLRAELREIKLPQPLGVPEFAALPDLKPRVLRTSMLFFGLIGLAFLMKFLVPLPVPEPLVPYDSLLILIEQLVVMVLFLTPVLVPSLLFAFRLRRADRLRESLSSNARALTELATRDRRDRKVDPIATQLEYLEHLLGEWSRLQIDGKVEVLARLTKRQDERLQQHLKGASVAKLFMPSLGAANRAILKQLDFQTAADFSRRSMQQMEHQYPALFEALLNWQSELSREFYQSGKARLPSGPELQVEIDRAKQTLHDQIQRTWRDLQAMLKQSKPSREADLAALQRLLDTRRQLLDDYQRVAGP